MLASKYERADVPQFFGKWPFVRFLGLQEPVSVLASLANMYANVHMLRRMRRAPGFARSRFRWLWLASSAVSVNAWLWSTLFHAKDSRFTEAMDYFSAFAFILFQFNSFFVRVCFWPPAGIPMSATKTAKGANALLARQYACLLVCAASALYFLYHVHYLSSVSFDYGYNMTANILVGSREFTYLIKYCLLIKQRLVSVPFSGRKITL